MRDLRIPVCVILLSAVISTHADVTVIDEGDGGGEAGLKGAIVPTKALPVWTLNQGKTIGQELQAWGEKAGWRVIWNLSKDWAVPAPTSFKGEFPTAAAEVIKTLAANGALVRMQIYNGNKTLVITGPGVE